MRFPQKKFSPLYTSKVKTENLRVHFSLTPGADLISSGFIRGGAAQLSVSEKAPSSAVN